MRVFGDFKRVGAFRMEERTSGTLVFGDALYDLREAEIPENAELTIYSLFGDVKVIVPPGMQVTTSGALVFGEDKIETAQAGADGPTLKIHHVALFGDTKVKTALPGEKISKRWRWF